MAINPGDLVLWVGNETIDNSRRLSLSISWEVRHRTLNEIVESGPLFTTVAKQGDLVSAWGNLVDRAEQMLKSVQSYHEPIPAIGNLSLHDCDLVLDSWLTDSSGYEHPVCGDLAGPVPNNLPARLSFILASVSPPPVWFWADSVAPGELRVKCVQVSGADSYNIYDGDLLLGNVPTNGWETLSVAAGTYSVRMAALDGTQVGILSFPISVEVA